MNGINLINGMKKLMKVDERAERTCRSPSATLSFHFILLFLMGRMIEMKCAAGSAAPSGVWNWVEWNFNKAREGWASQRKRKINHLFLFDEERVRPLIEIHEFSSPCLLSLWVRGGCSRNAPQRESKRQERELKNEWKWNKRKRVKFISSSLSGSSWM